MHHAYPRECPYPHMSGTTVQEPADTWSDGNGGDSVATQEELEQFTNSSTIGLTDSVDDVHDLMMWSHEEELLIVRPTFAPTTKTGFATQIRNVISFAALASMVYGIVHTVTASSDKTSETAQKFMV